MKDLIDLITSANPTDRTTVMITVARVLFANRGKKRGAVTERLISRTIAAHYANGIDLPIDLNAGSYGRFITDIQGLIALMGQGLFE